MWGWAGVARAVPPLVCMGGAGLDAPSILLYVGRVGRVGLGWRGLCGGVGAPSLLSHMRAGWGRVRGAGAGVTCAEGDWGGHAVLYVGKGGAGGQQAHANLVAQTRGKGLRAPYLRAKGWWQSMWGTGGRGRGGRGRWQVAGGARIGDGCPVLDPVAEASRACHVSPHAPCPALPRPAPPRPARIRERRGSAPTPPHGPCQPNPTCPALPMYTRGRMVHPAHPAHAHKGRDGMHSPALLGMGHQPNPTRLPAFATPVQPPTTHACKGEGRRVHPLRMGYTSPVFTHPATPMHPQGCKRVGGGPHTREGGTWNEGRCNPSASGGVAQRVCGQGGAERNPGGGATHECKDRHIGVWVQKGECDGKGVVNEVKQSWGEAVRTNGRHPAPVD
ncbi:hypothetical protein EDB89DRAFT_1914111 [Lactarius sanguifluus]|nr:hypothetical protein EDB89DRAFT_1914111 [Lactarius sanguifluus]